MTINDINNTWQATVNGQASKRTNIELYAFELSACELYWYEYISYEFRRYGRADFSVAEACVQRVVY